MLHELQHVQISFSPAMLRYCVYLITLCATLLQAAPPVDQAKPSNGLLGWDYALVNSNELIPQLQLQLWQQNLDEKELTVVLIQLLQINMMKILLILDIMIMLCLLFACIYRNGDISYKIDV